MKRAEAKEDGKIRGKMMEIPIEKVVPNAWNPNVMDEKEFNLLVQNYQSLPGACRSRWWRKAMERT